MKYNEGFPLLNESEELFLRFSSLLKLNRVIAYYLKENTLHSESKTAGLLMVAELERAMMTILISSTVSRIC